MSSRPKSKLAVSLSCRTLKFLPPSPRLKSHRPFKSANVLAKSFQFSFIIPRTSHRLASFLGPSFFTLSNLQDLPSRNNTVLRGCLHRRRTVVKGVLLSTNLIPVTRFHIRSLDDLDGVWRECMVGRGKRSLTSDRCLCGRTLN